MRYSSTKGFYELNNFPGCNQVVVSNHTFIYKEKRGKGYGSIQHKERLAKASSLGYDYIICTVKVNNKIEIEILEKNGWKRLDTFYNTETDNDIYIYGRKLNEQLHKAP